MDSHQRPQRGRRYPSLQSRALRVSPSSTPALRPVTHIHLSRRFWPVTVIFDVNTNPNRSSEDRVSLAVIFPPSVLPLTIIRIPQYASADSFSGSASGSGSQSSQSNGGRRQRRVRSQSSGSSRSASQSGSGPRLRQRRNRSRSPVGSATSSQRRRSTRHSSARSLNGGTARSAGGRRSRRGSVRSRRSESRSSSPGARRQRRNRRRASRSSSRSSSIDRAARAIAAISLIGAPRRQRSRRNGSVRAGGSQY